VFESGVTGSIKAGTSSHIYKRRNLASPASSRPYCRKARYLENRKKEEAIATTLHIQSDLHDKGDLKRSSKTAVGIAFQM